MFSDELKKMIDSSVKLFGGDTSLKDIMDMEIEEFREAVEVRAEQRRKSLERFNETGEKDMYVDSNDSNEILLHMMSAMFGMNGIEWKGNKPVKMKEKSKNPNDYLRQREFLQSLRQQNKK